MTRDTRKSIDLAAGYDCLLNVAEAAHLLRLGRSTLNKMRVNGDGPKYRKLGRRVLYSRQDLLDWAESRTFRSTSDRRA